MSWFWIAVALISLMGIGIVLFLLRPGAVDSRPPEVDPSAPTPPTGIPAILAASAVSAREDQLSAETAEVDTGRIPAQPPTGDSDRLGKIGE